MRIQTSIAGAIFLILFVGANVDAQTMKPSTPEERATAVQLAHLLESDPLGKDSKKARKWLSDWIVQKVGFAIPSCSDFLPPGEKEHRYSEEISFQIRASTAAFIIEHADQAQDPAARVLAGIVGMLKAYTMIVKKSPQSNSEYLNSLLKAQDNNQLHTRVREMMTRCSDVPLSDKNLRSATGEMLYAPIEVERPARIADLPFPKYVPTARRNFTQGKVVLHVVLSSDGNVTDIAVIKGLPDGLTESSINAARAIKFEPAFMHGKPVSTIIRLEYRFTAERGLR